MENILEIGCGCGSSLLPVLKANPGCRVTGTDVSPTAVQLFTTAARTAGVSDDRVCAFTLDSTDPQQCRQMYAGAVQSYQGQPQDFMGVWHEQAMNQRDRDSDSTIFVGYNWQFYRQAGADASTCLFAAGMEADGCLMIFTLAALLPHLMHTMLDAAFQVRDMIRHALSRAK